MISSVRIATPPIPGQVQAPAAAPQAAPQAPATPPQPRTATPPPLPQAQPSPFGAPPLPGAPPQPQAPPQGPAPQPGAPPTAPPSYWTAAGQSFATLPEIGAAVAAGRIPQGQNGTVSVQRVEVRDSAGQQAIHKSNAARYFKNSMIVGMAGTFGAMLFPPLAMAGMVLSAWNGLKGWQETQAAAQVQPTQNTVVEEGRIKGGGSFYNYEAVDNDSYWNMVPSHPFGFKPGVPLDQVR